jgi:hypothetical protein
MRVPPAPLHAYDVLQIKFSDAQEWQDYCTLRDDSEFLHARRMVRFGAAYSDGRTAEFRVRRGTDVVLYRGKQWPGD